MVHCIVILKCKVFEAWIMSVDSCDFRSSQLELAANYIKKVYKSTSKLRNKIIYSRTLK